ncbi:DUF3564 family protein [Caballeronia grimmiae]|uniref:DUF3564 family protein n=1 Tax=Caballeronia grimmiae TaxID=1071679 RepID=UPI0038BD21B4
MYITLHLDTFDRVNPCAYANLEIDQRAGTWTSSSQRGLHMPREGVVEKTARGTELRRAHDSDLICILEGLDAVPNGPPKGETGPTLWYGEQAIQPASGHWHVELVTDESEERRLMLSRDALVAG